MSDDKCAICGHDRAIHESGEGRCMDARKEVIRDDLPGTPTQYVNCDCPAFR